MMLPSLPALHPEDGNTISMANFDYPLLLAPIPVPKVWAGERLCRLRGWKEKIGESWDVSTWPTAPDNPQLQTVSRITNGPLTGTLLDRVTEMPVVAKVIDSGALLSVQSHPHRPDEHKNEMWYLFDADPDAFLYLGVAEGVTAASFCDLLREEPADEQKILGALVRYDHLAHGRFFSVPAPTVHALGPGLLTFEISERSQITYRLFDYNRPRSRGKLDIDEGCHALQTATAPPPALQPSFDLDCPREEIAAFSTFCVWKVTGERLVVHAASHQHLITASTGPCRLSGPTPDWSVSLDYTATCLAPPTDGPYTIETGGEVLISPLEG